MIAQLSVLMPARKGKNDRAPSDQAVIYEDVVERTVKPPRSNDKHRRGPEHAPLAMALPAEAEDTKSSLRVWKYRYEETIVAALSRWWVVNENTFDDVDGDGVMDLTKDQYLSVLRKVGKALTPPPDYDIRIARLTRRHKGKSHVKAAASQGRIYGSILRSKLL